MNLTYANGIFNCICSYAEKDYAKDAGFVWDKITPKTWATKDAGVAYKLIKYADAKALPEISKYMNKAIVNMDASRAKDSSAKIPCPEGLEYLPYQRAGIDYISKLLSTKEGTISSLSGVLLADEMG